MIQLRQARQLSFENVCGEPFKLTPEDVDREEVDKVLLEGDNVYHIAFLPTVLAWVAFDYTEDVCNQAATLKLNYAAQTRKLRTFMSDHNRYFRDEMMRKVSAMNGEGLQEQFAETIAELYAQIKQHIRLCKPTIKDEMLYLYCSVYMAMFAFRALFSYAYDCDKFMQKRVRSYTQHSIILPHHKAIYAILPDYLGSDKNMIDVRDLDDYSQRLVAFIKTAKFI